MYYVQLAVNGLSQGLVVGLAALGITLVLGIARFANASAGDGLSFGAYMAVVGQRMTGSLLLGAGLAIVASALASVLGYKLIFKQLAGRSSEMAGVAALCLGVAFGTLHLTPIGRQMRALADNPDLARVSGIRPERVMIALWCLVGGITAVAGLILGIKTVVSPEIGWEMLLPAFAAAILGGIGSPLGAVLAGLLLGAAQELSTPFVGFTYKIALSFVIILLVLLFRPRGLLGRVEGVR